MSAGANDMEKKLELIEKARFVLWDNMVVSEVRIGRTLFEVTSLVENKDNTYKDIIGRITARQINRINQDAG